MRLRGVLFAALCGALVMSCRPASAQLDPGMLLGRWTGLSNSLAMSPGADVAATLNVSAARDGHLVGTLEIIPCIFPVDLTVSDSGRVSGGGVEADGARIRVTGQLAAFGDGSVRSFGDGSVRHLKTTVSGGVWMAALRFNALMGDGSVRKGHMMFVRMLGGADWDQTEGTNVSGAWKGRHLLRDGSAHGLLDMDLLNLKQGRTEKTTGLKGAGNFVFGDGSVRNFDMQGTIGLPAVQSGMSRYALIGLLRDEAGGDSQGIIAILIGLLLPAVQDNPMLLTGDFMFFHSLEEVFVAVNRGGGGFSGGGIYLPAVQ